MTETTRQALDLLIRIIFYSGFVAAPVMILIIVMYQYEKYKKWKDKEIKEAERIIVKKNESIIEATKSIQSLEKLEMDLKEKVHSYENRLSDLKAEIGEDDDIEDDSEDESNQDIDHLTIKELHDIARDKNIKGFSRMKKKDLIERLRY